MWLAVMAISQMLLEPSQESVEATSAPYEVVRLGDGQMTCETLVGEINALSAQVQSVQTALTARATAMSRAATETAQRSMAAQSAMSLGSVAASLIPGADLVLGAASSLGRAGARSKMASEQDRILDEVDAMVQDASSIGPQTQRLEHLSEISRGKGC